MKKLLILGINLLALSFILCLVSCEPHTGASIKTIVIHDTIDNTLTAQEYAAVMDIRNGKTAAHVCGAETKTGKPCKKRTKTQFCHLHTK